MRRRKQIRKKGHDYTQPGIYMITICTQHRETLFGEIVDGKMLLNDAGKMIGRWYKELENKFPQVRCDEFICMPDHVHFIIIISQQTDHPNPRGESMYSPLNHNRNITTDEKMYSPPDQNRNNPIDDSSFFSERDGYTDPSLDMNPPGKSEHSTTSLIHVIQWFKIMTTNEYIRMVKECGWQRFHGKLWQRSYHDRFIRHEKDIHQVRNYIRNNPANWGKKD